MNDRTRQGGRCIAVAAFAVIAVAVGVPTSEDGSAMAAGTAEDAKAKRVVVSPRAGKVIRSHRARLRVRSRGLSGVLAARLNGVPIGDDFGRPRRGVRGLRVSVSHGLRRGRNVLKVRVRRRGLPPRRATVRFFVRTKRPLVGAGRHRRIVIGSRSRLYGQVKHAVTRGARRSARSKLRWKLVGGPGRSAIRAAGAGARRPLAKLTSPVGLTAGFRPRALGSYTLQLTHGSGKSATRDRVTLDAVPRSPLVPIDTMISRDRDEGGIRVGDRTFLLRDAVGNFSNFQVLVLDRKTLAPVQDPNGRDWNRKYTSVSALGEDLKGLDDTKLVIYVQQPFGSLIPMGEGELNDVLGRIGVPNYGQIPARPGLVSAIGVPGMARGDADVNVVSDFSHSGRMTGYLTPDQYLNYGYVPSQRYAFSYGGKEVDPCTAGTPPPCTGIVGYRLNVKDPRTFEARPGDNRVYNTGVSQQTVEANRMAADLNAVKSDDVVIIQTVSTPWASGTKYRAPVGTNVDKATMKTLAAAVARVGGSRNAFNRTARLEGAPASGGAVYMLAGWAGAREGAGAEVAAGVEGAGDAPRLGFVLRPDRQSRFRPAQDTNSDKNTDALSELMFRPPRTTWPLDDDPGAKKAIAFLGSTDPQLGSDPRSSYWTLPLDQAATKDISDGLDRVAYQFGQGFTGAQFVAAREQLQTELKYVGRIRAYLTNLSRPFAENALKDWTTAQNIADDIYKDVNRPDEEVAFRWIEFTEIILDLLGPATHDVTAAIAAAMELGVWAYGATGGGSPTDQEIRAEADKLGQKLVEEAQQTQAMFARMGDVIVSDWDKLQELGKVAGCKPDPDPKKCPPAFSLTTADLVAASADVYTSIRQMAYAELLPLAYHVFALTQRCFLQDDCEKEIRSVPPNPRHYNCSGAYPWEGYSSPAASTSLLQALDLVGPNHNNHSWDTFILSVPPGALTVHGTPPSDALLGRAFGPISRSGDPKAGGSGLSLARLALETKLYYWYGDPNREAQECGWEH